MGTNVSLCVCSAHLAQGKSFFFVEENNAYKETYIPLGISSGETCFCGFDLALNDQKCIYCLHKYRKEIETSVLLGEVSKNISPCYSHSEIF